MDSDLEVGFGLDFDLGFDFDLELLEARQAITASKCREAIPAYSHPIMGQGSQTQYPSMHSTDTLSQHALTHSEAREARHTIPACIAKYTLNKEGCKAQNSRQADMVT